MDGGLPAALRAVALHRAALAVELARRHGPVLRDRVGVADLEDELVRVLRPDAPRPVEPLLESALPRVEGRGVELLGVGDGPRRPRRHHGGEHVELGSQEPAPRRRDPVGLALRVAAVAVHVVLVVRIAVRVGAFPVRVPAPGAGGRRELPVEDALVPPLHRLLHRVADGLAEGRVVTRPVARERDAVDRPRLYDREAVEGVFDLLEPLASVLAERAVGRELVEPAVGLLDEVAVGPHLREVREVVLELLPSEVHEARREARDCVHDARDHRPRERLPRRDREDAAVHGRVQRGAPLEHRLADRHRVVGVRGVGRVPVHPLAVPRLRGLVLDHLHVAALPR